MGRRPAGFWLHQVLEPPRVPGVRQSGLVWVELAGRAGWVQALVLRVATAVELLGLVLLVMHLLQELVLQVWSLSVLAVVQWVLVLVPVLQLLGQQALELVLLELVLASVLPQLALLV